MLTWASNALEFGSNPVKLVSVTSNIKYFLFCSYIFLHQVEKLAFVIKSFVLKRNKTIPFM